MRVGKPHQILHALHSSGFMRIQLPAIVECLQQDRRIPFETQSTNSAILKCTPKVTSANTSQTHHSKYSSNSSRHFYTIAAFTSQHLPDSSRKYSTNSSRHFFITGGCRCLHLPDASLKYLTSSRHFNTTAGKVLLGGGGKAVFRTIASLSFIDMAIFPRGSFNAGAV